MNASRLLNALNQERSLLQTSALSPDLLGTPQLTIGMIRGLTLAIRITRKMIDEERNQRTRIEISREQAFDVRKRCLSALNCFKRGDPARAKQALEKLLSRLCH